MFSARLLLKALTWPSIRVAGCFLLLFGLFFGTIFAFSPEKFLAIRKSYYHWQSDFTEKSLQVGDHYISYLENGSENKKGQPIVMLHSFGSNKNNFLKFGNQFSENHRVLILDLPGFGKSSKIRGADYTIESQRRSIARFLKKKKISRAHFVGNSFGALTSAAVYLLIPEQVLSLGLFAPPGAASAKPSTSQIFKKTHGYNAFAVKNREEYYRMLGMMFVDPPWVPGHFADYLAAQSKAGRPFLNYMLTQLKAAPQQSFEPYMHQVKVPTLVLWGQHDQVLHVSGAKIFHRGIAGSKLVILDNCGHVCHVEQTHLVARHYHSFLDKVENSLTLSKK